MTRRTAYIAIFLTLLVSAPVFAQDNKVAAEALFDQARKLVKDGKYAEACAKFEQSQKLDPGIGTLLYLADCYEKSGRLASAWATFREGASQARAAGQRDRAHAGEARADAIEPRLSKLTIRVAQENLAMSGLSVTRGNEQVERALFGVAVPVDGGNYEIRASAQGKKTWTQTVTVANERGSANVEIPPLEVDPNAETTAPVPSTTAEAPPPAPTATATAPPATDPPMKDTGSNGATQRTLGLVFGGVGVVGLGVGSYFGLRAISKNKDAKSFCDGTACRDQQGVTLTNDAKSAATISNVAFGVGLAALTAGIVLFATAPSSSEKAAKFQVAPTLAPGLASVTLGGRF